MRKIKRERALRDPLSRLEKRYSPARYERCLTEAKKGEIRARARSERAALAKISREIRAIEVIRIKNRRIYTVGAKGQS
jgi:hypothetical protein